MSSNSYLEGKLLKKRTKDHTVLYLMAFPGLLFFLIFRYIPMAGLLLAFKEFEPARGIASIISGKWIGLANFERFFSAYYFSRVFINTLKISGLKIVFGFCAAILLALLLNEVKNAMNKRFIQTISYLPHFLSWVVVASIIQILLSPSMGPVKQLYEALGWQPVNLLIDRDFFVPLLIVSDIWKGVGWSSIIYLAAIASIGNEPYEAATIDGATRLQKICYITLPGIREVAVVVLILSIGSLLEAGFEQVYLLYSPPVYAVSDIIDTYVFREGLVKMDYSFSTAVSLTKSVIAFILIIASNSFAKKFGTTGIW